VNARRRVAEAVLVWAFAVRILPDAGEQRRERGEVARAERAERRVVGSIHGRVEPREQREPLCRHAAVHQATVVEAPRPGHPALRLEPVQQARDAGGLLDQPLGDGGGGQRLRVGAAQNAQHVVLRQCNPGWLYGGRKPAPDHVGGAQDGDSRLLRRRPERASVAQLVPEGRGAGG